MRVGDGTPGPGRPKGSKNKLSIKQLCNLQTPEKVAEQYDALMGVIRNGSGSEKTAAIKLIWTMTFDQEERDDLIEDIKIANKEQFDELLKELLSNGQDTPR